MKKIIFTVLVMIVGHLNAASTTRESETGKPSVDFEKIKQELTDVSEQEGAEFDTFFELIEKNEPEKLIAFLNKHPKFDIDVIRETENIEPIHHGTGRVRFPKRATREMSEALGENINVKQRYFPTHFYSGYTLAEKLNHKRIMEILKKQGAKTAPLKWSDISPYFPDLVKKQPYLR